MFKAKARHLYKKQLKFLHLSTVKTAKLKQRELEKKDWINNWVELLNIKNKRISSFKGIAVSSNYVIFGTQWFTVF